MNDRSNIGGGRGKFASWMFVAVCAGSCTMDERPVFLASSLTASADAGSGTTLPGGSRLGGEAAGLEYGPAELDIGSVVLGYAAFGRVRLFNGGTESSTMPAISLAAGSSPSFAIAQNQCDGPLPAGSSCDVRIQVIPSATGNIEATLQLSHEGGALMSVPLTALGVAGGDLALRPAEGGSVDFGGVLVGSPSEARFRVSNPVAAASGALKFSLTNSEFQLASPQGAECQSGATLAGGQSCDLRVIYTPGNRGRQDATLTVTSTDLGSESLGLVGRGLIQGAFAVTPPTQDFRGAMLGSVALASVLVQNRGDLPLIISGIAIEDDTSSDFAIASAQCGAGATLAGGDFPDSCRLELEYRPRATGDATAALVLTSDAGIESRVQITGRGLLPGTLLVTSASGMSADFGDVLVGQSSAIAFTVSNPGAEPSGTFSIEASGGFAVLPGASPTDCQPGQTSLANGESCTVTVALAPTVRTVQAGSLTIESQLAGSASVALSGRGILPPLLATAQDEVSFGRVVRGRPSQGSLSVRNDGDAPLTPPALAINATTSGVASDFTWSSACAEQLDPGAQCDVTLTLLPTATGPYSATVGLTSTDGGSASVLLLAEAIEPGSLVLASEASSPDFGDTAVNVPVTKTFTVTNPGGEPSGPLSITTNDTHFVVESGPCGAGIGIANGDSCTFTVTFTPDSSLALTANLSVESITAGVASLSLTGRGRSPATLAGSNQFNFNTVVATQRSLPRPWRVTNTGDLPTALLTTTGATPEFAIDSDTCNGQSLAPAGTCTMNVTFAPQATGSRQTAIAVTDTAEGGSVATLTASGIGQALPAVGEACLAGSCAAGATCENHSNGVAQVCCGADCTGNQRCSEGQNFLACELPTVGPGARCVAGTNVCGAGLTCTDPNRPGFCCPTACTGPCQACAGAGTCDPLPDQTKGGCGGNKVCVGGICNCSGLDRESLDCGGDRCIRDVADACCDDNGCAGGDVCGATNLCGCPAGTRECTPGTNDCTPNAQCCNCGGPCSQCVNGQCLPLGNGQTGSCTGGQVCQNGSCAALPDVELGQACNRTANNCANGSCTDGICDCSGDNPTRCGNRCLPLGACCDDNFCGPCGTCTAEGRCLGCPDGQECDPQTNVCGCGGDNPTPCGNRCLPLGACCDDSFCQACGTCTAEGRCLPCPDGQCNPQTGICSAPP